MSFIRTRSGRSGHPVRDHHLGPEEVSSATTPAPSPNDISPEPVELEKLLEVKDEAPLTNEIVSSEIAPDAAERAVTESDTLLKRLTNIGMNRRVAKELLEQHEHGLIVAAIENVKGRPDIKNRAGYVLRLLRDGGYEEMRKLAMDEKPLKDTRATESDAPRVYSSAELTRAEMMAMEAEKAAKQQEFAQTLRDLQERCARLSEDLRGQLRECCQRHLAQLVPKTSRSEMWMENPVYKKLAFKDVMERFFGLVDQGFGPEDALLQVAQ
jgi:cell division septum initiation protein DivIVA